MKQSGKLPRGREKCQRDLENLARTLPGGAKPERGTQSLLLDVLSYIEFLQRMIQDAQNKLTPPTPPQASLPLWPYGDPRGQKSQVPHCRPRKRRRTRAVSAERCRAVLQSRRCLSLERRAEREPRSPEKQSARRGRHSAGSAGADEESELCSEDTARPRLRQALVSYLSSSDDSDAGPWLPSLSPPGLHCQATPCPPQVSTHSPLHLGLSPSLLSSPGHHILQGSSAQVLFEEVQLSSCSSPDLLNSQGYALPVAFTLDHSYQSQGVGSPVGGDRRQVKNGSGEKRVSHGFSRLQLLRKKCVNGFIMFCRVNRRPYLSARPGTASTTATKELAELWREMSAQERRPYCIRALQFSLLHGRLVKQCSLRVSHEDLTPPKPLSVLLAEKTLRTHLLTL
ncbi:meiosis initiator protein isoform X1 [Ascaphus truei]|uniref:meiosis initiator protein isoform X1 n=2 Tax=Ascaphus truei TaxID=8439 RepID=UPI003F59DA42